MQQFCAAPAVLHRGERGPRTGAWLGLALFGFIASTSGLHAQPQPQDSISEPSLKEWGLPKGLSKFKSVKWLINPRLRTGDELQKILKAYGQTLGKEGSGFDDDQLQALSAPNERGETVYYAKIRSLIHGSESGGFLNAVSKRDDNFINLKDLLDSVRETKFPVLTVDAVSYLRKGAPGGENQLETLLTFRVFVLQIEADGEVKKVTSCALHYEDTAAGRGPLPRDADIVKATEDSLKKALKGRLVLSFCRERDLRPKDDSWPGFTVNVPPGAIERAMPSGSREGAP